MKLLVEIAWTHVTTRIRQTLVGILGVGMGVGFTIMIAGLMEGGQRDFIRQLVDTLPHVTVSDERRAASAQPAEREYAAVQVTNMPSAERRTGIKNPNAVVASIEVLAARRGVAVPADHGAGAFFRRPCRHHGDRDRSAARGQGLQARQPDAARPGQ